MILFLAKVLAREKRRYWLCQWFTSARNDQYGGGGWLASGPQRAERKIIWSKGRVKIVKGTGSQVEVILITSWEQQWSFYRGLWSFYIGIVLLGKRRKFITCLPLGVYVLGYSQVRLYIPYSEGRGKLWVSLSMYRSAHAKSNQHFETRHNSNTQPQSFFCVHNAKGKGLVKCHKLHSVLSLNSVDFEQSGDNCIKTTAERISGHLSKIWTSVLGSFSVSSSLWFQPTMFLAKWPERGQREGINNWRTIKKKKKQKKTDTTA